MNHLVIQTSGLTRYFGRKCAVDQVNLRVPRGSVFALLGRNGSGKSTLIRMLMGILEPTRGSATVLDQDSRQLSPATRGKIAYVAEGHPLIGWMRVRELEAFQRSFYPDWDTRLFQTVIQHFDLDTSAVAKHLSRGQRAGVSLALALATHPELLVMDDPAMGLDPVARRTLLEAMILLTRDSGHTIFFSSHILDDVERVAEHVGILDQSVLRVCCSVETFRQRVKRYVLTFSDQPPEGMEIPGLIQAQREGHELHLILANPSQASQAALQALRALQITETPLSLEDAVIGYLGQRGQRSTLLQATREMEAVH